MIASVDGERVNGAGVRDGGDRVGFTQPCPRRRVLVFLSAFALAAVGSLTYVYTQPAQYLAVSRLQITPAEGVAEPETAKPPSMQQQPQSFLREIQILTSRPLIESAIDRLKQDAPLPDLGPDPVASIQTMLQADPIDGTEIVQLSAAGPQRLFVAQLVNALAAAYQTRTLDDFSGRSSTAYSEVSDEARKIQAQITAKRDQVNAYRNKYNIISLEREENSVLADIQNLSQSYANSTEALAKAQGRLEGLKDAAAHGGPALEAKDDPTLADMEQRASALREQLRELQRKYTPEYLRLDQNAVSLEARLASLEQQLTVQRAARKKTILANAEQEYTSSRGAVDRMRRDLAENQSKARQFAARLADFKVLQEDLDHLQTLERAATDRLTKLEASERERAPKIEIVEAAAPSVAPWRPDYGLQALVALGASFLVGLFAVWFDGYLLGPAPQRAILVHHAGPALAAPAAPAFARMAAYPFTPLARPLNDAAVLQLAPRNLPRELHNKEVSSLLGHSSGDIRLAAVALLSGLSPAEILRLRWDQVNLASGRMKIAGEAARSLSLDERFLVLLRDQRRTHLKAAMVFEHSGGEALSEEDLDRLILCAAYDAGLDQPQQITPAALRHTYLLFLLGSGLRAADIDRVAGMVPREDLIHYVQKSDVATRLPLDQIDPVFPALRELSIPAGI